TALRARFPARVLFIAPRKREWGTRRKTGGGAGGTIRQEKFAPRQGASRGRRPGRSIAYEPSQKDSHFPYWSPVLHDRRSGRAAKAADRSLALAHGRDGCEWYGLRGASSSGSCRTASPRIRGQCRCCCSCHL